MRRVPLKVSANLRGFACVILLLVCSGSYSAAFAQGWPAYGGDSGGTRYSPLAQINRGNLSRLKIAWTYSLDTTEALKSSAFRQSFEATPILAQDTLYFSTPLDMVIALDPETGEERWSFAPHIDQTRYHAFATSRGVAFWRGKDSKGRRPAFCGSRIFIGTMDGTLLALDATTGKPCPDFGDAGVVDLTKDVHYERDIEYQVTSAPTIVGDVVIVGSSIGDNQAVDSESGVVRGFDTRSGKLIWSWDPIPWANRQKIRTGAANAWSTISADPQLGLIYVPTGSASPDYYGGLRPGDNKYADSIVALDAATGQLRWGFQLIQHDLWDYDLAAQPLLFMFQGHTPAVAVATKTGSVFVFDRRTGKPLVPVEERQVPQSDVPGEKTSTTQPFSSLPALGPQDLRPNQAWGDTPENQRFCHDQLAALRYEGMFTPPSLKGSLLFPGNIGGVNWGSLAFDPGSGILYANNNRWAALIQLVPREQIEGSRSLFARLRRFLGRLFRRVMGWLGLSRPSNRRDSERTTVGGDRFNGELSRQSKTPYYIRREPIVSHDGLPCNPLPWGALSAINLNTGKKLWEVPLGTMIPGMKTGTVGVGGPIVTAGGLVFTAATQDPLLRAFDAKTGDEIWQGKLPSPAFATPMTYSFHGKQYVVIFTGESTLLGKQFEPSMVAFSLR
jgi:quinoprotein glucose dehydrogenase